MDLVRDFMAQPPRRLKKDAILEALYEVRFESGELPELVIGRLVDKGRWKDFAKERLPVSNIPTPIRINDPGLKSQPVLELRSEDSKTIVKIGSNVFSYHILSPYRGWQKFSAEIAESLAVIFNAIDNFRAVRFGFRYLNALTEKDHYIKGFSDLTTSVKICDEELFAPINLNYSVNHGERHTTNVRIASPHFVSGPTIQNMTVFVDVDVFTPELYETNDAELAISWMAEAHNFEKKEFFRLIPDEILDRIVEER